MTIRQLLFRFLKEYGKYKSVYNEMKSYHEKGREHLLNDDLFLFDVIKDVLSYDRKLGPFLRNNSLYTFLKSIALNSVNIENGDIITVETTDGKYCFNYKVEMVWYHNFTVDCDNAVIIKFDRIVAVNGKEINTKDCWRLKDCYTIW